MHIAITSLLSVIGFCAFIMIAIYLGTVAAIILIYAICFAAVTTSIGIAVGVAAVIAERIERRREVAHGG